MAFNNADIIKLLTARGRAIQNEQWEKKTIIEAEIEKVKNEKHQSLTTPCSVFMTFETEEGNKRALNLNSVVKENEQLAHLNVWLEQHSIVIKQAA